MVVACCKFLCYFCRTSGTNQKAMFEHLGYLLENSSMLLCECNLLCTKSFNQIDTKLLQIGRHCADLLRSMLLTFH